ncbi:hypothetical protein CCP1ISM_60042 [Azospirillaceae bacterium]
MTPTKIGDIIERLIKEHKEIAKVEIIMKNGDIFIRYKKEK